MLVTDFELEQPIIGYNVIKELIKNQEQVSDEAYLISLLSASFSQISPSNLNAFVKCIDSKTTSEYSTVKMSKKEVIIPKGSSIKVSCRNHNVTCATCARKQEYEGDSIKYTGKQGIKTQRAIPLFIAWS